jgi:hypothetical protein
LRSHAGFLRPALTLWMIAQSLGLSVRVRLYRTIHEYYLLANVK